MKNIKFTTILVCLFFPLMALSQTGISEKKIEVNGEAEMEVTPDEIYIRIVLKEYMAGKKKVEMDKLESRLVKAVQAEGFPDTSLRTENVSGYNWNWKKQRSEEFLATKSFRLTVGDLKKINNLLERLDERGVNNVGVTGYTHSKLKEYQKELKLEALKNAKEQAKYLLEGIGEQLGPVIQINEFNTNQPHPVAFRASNLEAADASGYQSNVEFKSIKIKSSIRAVFGIQ